jgi:hypothetical protein
MVRARRTGKGKNKAKTANTAGAESRVRGIRRGQLDPRAASRPPGLQSRNREISVREHAPS